MQVLSSLSSIPFYAPSAGFAPTNSADVSAIASAYAKSAASSKLDSTASSSFYPSDNPSGFISSVDLSDYATTAYVDSSVSSKLDATASSQFLTSVPTGYATTEYVDSSISGFAYESAVSAWTAKQDALTFGYNAANQISSIDGSALGGMDEAAVSGIASAYAESAVSSKADSSALSSYALSADVSGTVDLVSTQSANWGGSALALSAGPGVKLEKSGNVLVASTDETVLFSGNITASNGTGALAYPPSAFDGLKIEWYGENTGEYGLKCSYFHNDGLNFSGLACGGIGETYNNYAMGHHFGYLTLTDSVVTLVRQCRYNLTNTGLGAFESGNGMFRVQRIIGINRTAEA